MRTTSAPREALVRMFDQARALEREPCLVMSTLVEYKPSDRDPEIGRLLGAAALGLERNFAEEIRRGQVSGEIAPGVDPAEAGRVLLVLYLGLYVFIRTGTAGKPVLRGVVRQVEALLPTRAAVGE